MAAAPTVKLMVAPAQYGPVLDGAIGVNGLMTTLIVAVFLQPLALVTLTVYTPPAAAVTPAMVGFCKFEAKAPGPAQV